MRVNGLPEQRLLPILGRQYIEGVPTPFSVYRRGITDFTNIRSPKPRNNVSPCSSFSSIIYGTSDGRFNSVLSEALVIPTVLRYEILQPRLLRISTKALADG